MLVDSIKFIYVLVILLSASRLVVSDFGRCETPHKERGLCVHMSDCTYLFSLIFSNQISEEDRTLLQKSQCGYDNTQTAAERRVLVCCPDEFCKDNPLKTNANGTEPGNVLPEAGVCGKVLSDRIYGGNVTKLDEFPWLVLIQYKKPNNVFDFQCGGSLINSRYVLTAAHCVKNGDIPPKWEVHGVRLGEWNISTNPDCALIGRNGRKECAPPHLDVGIELTIIHENYNSASLNVFNDIALIRMDQNVQYTYFIKPICLPTVTTLRNSLFKDTEMEAAGWGLTERGTTSEIKLKILVKTWDIERCNKKYRPYMKTINPEIQLCAGGQANVDTCDGDSGGPLMVSEEMGDRTIFFVAGIVSYGSTPCGLRGWPAVYTRVGKYVDWIESKLEP